jgi:thiopurine S-methyltransferase
LIEFSGGFMQAEFWQQRWEAGQIGFNQATPNSFLQRFWPSLGLAEGARVLVPLCGKSLDMTWLAAQGLSVVGVELSEKAVESYFVELSLEPGIAQRGSFKVYSAESVEIWCGDFFALTAEDIGRCDALYDRAALIALPEAMRERYVLHLDSLMSADTVGLLITLDYEQELMEGPPFSVPPQWVNQYLSQGWEVRELAAEDALPGTPRAQAMGLTRVDERVYRLTRKGPVCN